MVLGLFETTSASSACSCNIFQSRACNYCDHSGQQGNWPLVCCILGIKKRNVQLTASCQLSTFSNFTRNCNLFAPFPFVGFNWMRVLRARARSFLVVSAVWKAEAGAVPTEITLAWVCGEAGATVRRNVKLPDMNVHVPATHEREVEVLAAGLPIHHGSTSCGAPRPNAAAVNGAVLTHVRRDKEGRYSELLAAERCCLVLIALETGGRWSAEAEGPHSLRGGSGAMDRHLTWPTCLGRIEPVFLCARILTMCLIPHLLPFQKKSSAPMGCQCEKHACPCQFFSYGVWHHVEIHLPAKNVLSVQTFSHAHFLMVLPSHASPTHGLQLALASSGLYMFKDLKKRCPPHHDMDGSEPVQ